MSQNWYHPPRKEDCRIEHDGVSSEKLWEIDRFGQTQTHYTTIVEETFAPDPDYPEEGTKVSGIYMFDDGSRAVQALHIDGYARPVIVRDIPLYDEPVAGSGGISPFLIVWLILIFFGLALAGVLIFL